MKDADTDSHAYRRNNSERQWHSPVLRLAPRGYAALDVGGVEGCDARAKCETFEYLVKDDDDEEGDEDGVAGDDEGDAKEDGVEDDARFEDEYSHCVVWRGGRVGFGIIAVVWCCEAGVVRVAVRWVVFGGFCCHRFFFRG